MTRHLFQWILTNHSDKCLASTTFLRQLSHWDEENTLYRNVLFHQSMQLYVPTQPWRHISYAYLLNYIAVVKGFRGRLPLNSQRTEFRIRQNTTRIYFEVCYDHDITLCKHHHHQFTLSAWILMKGPSHYVSDPSPCTVYKDYVRFVVPPYRLHGTPVMPDIRVPPPPSCYCECFNGIY
jgi:hypothetical protein